ncbi:MAG: HTH-type transcriptional regulator/antitoxin HipB [Paraglaciecola sp.]|jgi:HTH-type transcriptional regulator/antitoxin HipB
MYINIPADLGGLIRTTRKALGWNQAYLASLVGIHQPDLSDIERDPKKANFGLLLKICAALQLKLSVNDLSGKQSSTNVDENSPTKNKDHSKTPEVWRSKLANKLNF